MRRTSAHIDLDAVRHNVGTLRSHAGGAAVMAVVKADGYGHGMLPCARAALEAGATWLGVAGVDEAQVLRRAGIDAPLLCWLTVPGDSAVAVDVDVDAGVNAAWALDEAAAAARVAGRPARVHLKVDTGLGRAGATVADWPQLCASAAKLEAEGVLDVVGVWSHFAYADAPGHPTVEGQITTFHEALEVAGDAGLRPRVRHLANSAATLTRTDTRFDLVRPGIAVYGLSPGPAVGTPGELGLRPAMTLRAGVAVSKRVPAGTGVSYAHRYTTDRETTLAVVPLGYGDGIPRHATNLGEVWLGGRRRRVAGTVCMDQFVVDVGDDAVSAGDEVLVFGPGAHGEPTAEEWAAAIGTIGYEIVTRIGARVPRVYISDGKEVAW